MKRRLAALSIAIALFFAVQPASPQTADVIREVHDGLGRTGSFLGAEPPLPSERLIASLGAAD